MVLQKIIENFLATLKEESDLNQWVYYITFDEYSLLHCENANFQQMLERKYGKKITCLSLQEITKQAKLSQMMSLEECFEYLSSKHGSEKVNVFIDELDAVFLTKDMASRINKLWKKPCYFNSTIVISFQSILKERVSHHATGSTVMRECFDMSLNAPLFNLPMIVRYSTQIMRIMDVVQKFVEKQENSYALPEKKYEEVQEASSVRPPNKSFPKKSSSKLRNNLHPDFDYVDSAPQPKISVDLDTLAMLSSSTVLRESESTESGLVSTRFMFPECHGCSHNFSGEKPTLVRFNIKDQRLSRLVITALANTFNPRWKNSLVIGNNSGIIRLVSHAFEALGVKVIEYLNALNLNYPANKLKDQIYGDWSSEENCALFTNSRGCRGIQHDRVQCFIFF